MAKKQKKPPPPEPEGESAPLWIISFCDLVMVMLGFFVIISAAAPPKLEYDPDWNAVVVAIKKAFKYIPNVDSDDPIDIQMVMGALKSNRKGRGDSGTSGKRGEAMHNVTGLAGTHDLVTTIRMGTQVTIAGAISFQKDSAKVAPEELPKILNIADTIRGHTNIFIIKGHTSRDEQYRLKGEDRSLSDARAKQVRLRLIAAGIAPEALRTQDCFDYEPLKVGAYSEIDHQINRRVEVLATEASVNDFRGEKEQPQQQIELGNASPTAAPADR